MSLRLRILLLIAAVNVGVLLLVVWLGLETAQQAQLVGPRALEEAFRYAHAAQPWVPVRERPVRIVGIC